MITIDKVENNKYYFTIQDENVDAMSGVFILDSENRLILFQGKFVKSPGIVFTGHYVEDWEDIRIDLSAPIKKISDYLHSIEFGIDEIVEYISTEK